MNNKRKGRGGSNVGRNDRGGPPPKPTKTPDKEMKELTPESSGEFSGIYNNARFTHALTSLIGVHLRVETKNKDEYEGIFKTFSPDLEIVLELTHKIDPNSQDTIDIKNVAEKMVFPLSQVVRYSATEVDMEFALKESFLTDMQISQAKTNGEATLRELEVWEPEEGADGDMIEGDQNMSGTGWSADDMFAKNEQRFGCKTSYDPDLGTYTVPLNRDNVDSETELKAAQIAASIEGSGNSKFNTECENGDEEEAFSAVIRPGDKRNGRERESPGDDKSTYVPPGKRGEIRDSRGGYSRGRGQRTPPPSRFDGYDDRDHRQRDDRRDRYSSNRSGGHRDDRGYGGGDRNSHQDRNDRGHQQGYHREERNYGGGGREERSYGRQDSHGKKEDFRESGGSSGSRGGSSYAHPDSGQQHNRGNNYQSRPTSSHENRRDDRKSSEKVSPLPPSEAEKAERRKSGGGGEMNRSPETDVGLPQRESARRKPDKTKEQNANELHDFHQKFHLKLSDNGSSGGPQISPGGGTPSVSINPDAGGAHHPQQQQPPPQSSPGSARGDPPAPSPRGDNKTPTLRPQNKPITPTQGGPNVASGPPPPHNSTPNHSSSSPHDSLKKSSLNPNAKEFTLNPGAKEFTPRMNPRPSATPPLRPQTPGTPGQMAPNMYANILPIQNQAVPQPMGGMSAAPFTPSNNNQRPLRPNSKDGGHLRPDLPSPIQVQQVTGQPILAQGLHPPGYFSPGQMQYVPGPGQPHFMRMVVPPGMIPGNLMPVPLSSHGGVPGQPGGMMGGVPEQNQQFIPTSQYQGGAPNPHHQMWSPQGMSTPSPMHPPTGPPQQGNLPHNTMAPTPPAQGHTPTPSPGPQIIGYAQPGHGQPNSLSQYPMIIMSGGAGIPQFPQSTPISGPPMGGHGQLMAGQPVTSLPSMAQHFQYVQGGQPIQMLGPNHHQQ